MSNIETARERHIAHSLRVIRAGQTPEGAYLAAPSFPTYRYSWFRDGAFIADAMDLHGQHDSAGAFHSWVVKTLAGRLDENGEVVGVAEVLHTRYLPDGETGKEEWPNFQLDGFGTWLWSYSRHLELTGQQAGSQSLETVRRLAKHLTYRWASPNFDCWEENENRVHPSTLGAIFAGMQAAAKLLDDRYFLGVAEAVRAYLLAHGVSNGHFVKHVDETAVDANLLWLSVPYGVVSSDDPLTRATIAAIEHQLQDPEGGVHRYTRDTYYGGGSWLLLTADLAQARLALGDVAEAERLARWMESKASPDGDMPEQVSGHLNDPSYLSEWQELWGPSAQPLLWSHAAYLRLVRSLQDAAKRLAATGAAA